MLDIGPTLNLLKGSLLMKSLIAILIAAFATTSVFAADDCAARAAEKKLAGAAKNSFMKKCQADANPGAAECEAAAKEKKLAGAAKNSVLKKCAAEAQAAAK